MTIKQSKDANEKLAEALPFWKAVVASCRDQGLDAAETHGLLVKCAQVDPILEEEFIQIKQAGGWDWLTKPLANAGRGIGGVFEAAAGGIGGLGAGIAGVGEAATDALGLTDANTNIGFDTAGTMFQGAGGGIKNVGRSLGVEGVNATADHGAKNYFTDVHEDAMDRGRYTDAQKETSRDILAGGRQSGQLAATLGLGSALTSGVHGLRVAGPGARLAGFGRGAMTGIRGSAPTLIQGASPFAPIHGARLAMLQQPGARLLHMGARNSLLPMTGLPGAAGYGGTAYQATSLPFLGEGIAGTVRGGGWLLGNQGLRTAGRVAGNAVRPGLAPALPTLAGAEVSNQLVLKYGYKPIMRQVTPRAAHSPASYSDAEGFAAYAAMPYKNRPLLADGEEIRLPGAEVWTEGLIKAQTDPKYTVEDAFLESLGEFQRNGGAPVETAPLRETARGRSLGHILPFKLQNIAYADKSPPTIELNDPAAALDFVSGPLEGFVGLMTEKQSKARVSDMLSKFGREMSPAEVAQISTEFLASPQGAQMRIENRIQLLDTLKGSMATAQHQSLLDVYKGQGVSTQLPDASKVHIQAPAPRSAPVPAPQPARSYNQDALRRAGIRS